MEGLHKQIDESAKSKAMAKYTWDVIVKPSLGYSFSSVHGYSYSIIGYQCAWLATKYPAVFWNTACLRVDSGIEDDATTSYNKISKAVGNIQNDGIQVLPIDINKSDYMFDPDERSGCILCGLKALSGVNGELVKQIQAGRPYTSLDDFQSKVQTNKTAMVSLIKSHAFDAFGSVTDVMKEYLMEQTEPKKKLTMANLQGLIDNRLIPSDYSLQVRTFVFNKSLRANCKYKEWYTMSGRYFRFYEQFFDVDELESVDGEMRVPQKKWQKMYTKAMEPLKRFIVDNQPALLDAVNSKAFNEQWDKYASGSQESWDIDSLGFYVGKHELQDVDYKRYGLSAFADLPEEPKVESCKGKFTIYALTRICGTVVAKDDTKSTVTIVTRESGSVDIKMPREIYAAYNRKIVLGEGDGKISEEGWFSRGTLLVACGYRQGNMFKLKRYKSTPSLLLYKVIECRGTQLALTGARLGEDMEE